MAKSVTMQDIATKIGVSKVTISKALSDKDGGVSDDLKAKIKALAEEMGYRFNASASAIKSGLSHNVGVIVAEHFMGNDSQAFYMTIYQRLAVALDDYRYSSILHNLSDDDESNLVLPRSYYDRKVDAYIVLGQVSNKYVDLLQNCEVPVLFLDFYDEHSDMDSINGDNYYGTYNMTNYLIKNEHTKIAFVGSINATSSILDRYLGYYKSLLEHKIVPEPGYVIEDRDEKGKYLPLVLPENMPTAFVCNCDRIAYNLIEDLNALGLEVPSDVSVVGYDNDIYSSLSKPQITTVDVNVEEMTSTASRMIVDKISNPDKTFGRILVKGNIIFRDSVSKAKNQALQT